MVAVPLRSASDIPLFIHLLLKVSERDSTGRGGGLGVCSRATTIFATSTVGVTDALT
jgi:hypothetical protein